MSQELGGWQRLGIVLAITWTFGVSGFVWSRWPTLAKVEHLTAVETQAPSADGEMVDWVDVAALEQSQSERSQVIHEGLVLWLVPLFGVGTAGYASRWVYEGFRR